MPPDAERSARLRGGRPGAKIGAAMSMAELREVVRQRWPDLPAPDARFDAFVQQRAGDDAALPQLHAPDLFLVHHALLGNARAVQAVQDRLARLRPVLLR